MVEIDNKLYNEIKLYCKANNLVVKDFLNKLIRKAFTIEKYGDKPFSGDNDLIVGVKKKQTEPLPQVVYSPYIIDDTPKVMITPESTNGELSEKIKERYSKPINAKFHSLAFDENWVNEEESNEEEIEEPKIVKKSKKRKL